MKVPAETGFVYDFSLTLVDVGPLSGLKVDNKANTPVQTVRADFPHTAYQWSVDAQHYAVLPLPGVLPQ